MKMFRNRFDISDNYNKPETGANSYSEYCTSGTFKIKADQVFQNESENNDSSKNQNGEEPSSNLNEHLNIKHPTSFWGTIFHVIFISAGSAVLLIPNVFIETGFVAGSITMLLIFAFYVHCMRMLLWSAQEICKLKRVSDMSYSDLVYETFETGPPFAKSLAWTAWFLINCNFIFEWYGGCILIVVLLADNLQTICSSWLDVNLELHGIVLLLFIPVLLLNLIRKLKFLEPCSILGFIFNFISILILLFYSITDPAPWKGQNQLGSLDNVFLLVGIVFININVTGLIISLKNEMKHAQKFEAPWGVMTISFSIIFIIYFLFSMFLGLKYGTSVPPNTLAIIPSNLTLYFLSVIFYVIGLYLLFPLIFYVPLNLILRATVKSYKEMMSHKVVCEYALRFILIVLAFLLAYLNPNIDFFMSLFGTFGTSVDSIIYPAMIHSLVVLKVNERNKGTALILTKNVILIFVGLCLIIGGFLTSLSQL